MRSKEYLQTIRQAQGLPRAVLKKIVVEGRSAVFHLVTDVTYTPEDVEYASRVSAQFVPQGFTAQARVMKSVPSEEGVRKAILSLLSSRFPAAAAFISEGDVGVAVDAGGGRFFLEAEESERARFDGDRVIDNLSQELERNFCGTWYGDLRFKHKERGEIVREEAPVEYVTAPRSFPVTEYSAIDGAAPKYATYIADLNKEEQKITVCGRIDFIEERETKAGKPYFTLTVSDGSGQMRASYFTRKATLDRVRDLRQGDSICLTGDNELYNGALSFRARAIDLGAPPADFVFEARPSRPVPPCYRTVFPVPVSDYVQATMFGETGLPQAFLDGAFVVFDLETTGLNNVPAGGMMDRIIEVGAVKIVSGRICEKFSTFVACPVRLSEEIIDLTGIDDGMLRGAPPIGEVMADFFRFADGCALVGHNVMFDYKFVHYYAEQEGYLFDRKLYDTCSLAQELLHLGNYKLNTVAEHFGFTFRHHRAFDDAFVTAKIFIELVKLKKSLPN